LTVQLAISVNPEINPKQVKPTGHASSWVERNLNIDVQLVTLLVIVVSAVIFIGSLQSDIRVNSTRLDRVEQDINEIKVSVKTLEKKVDDGFQSVSGRMDQRFDQINQRLDRIIDGR